MYARVATGLALLLLLTASPVVAQTDQEPETRVFTVTTYFLPFEKIGEYFDFIEKYGGLAADKENPHILGFKYLVHDWGSTDQTLWLISEYADMGEIEKAEDWGEEKFRAAYPDSTQRAAINEEFTEKFGEYFDHHTDNILVGQVNRMK